MRVNSRLAIVIGAIGLPLLLFGMLTLNGRLCLAGALLSGCAAIVYTLLLLRPD